MANIDDQMLANNRAVLTFLEGNIGEAVQGFACASTSDPNNAIALQNKRWILARQEMTEPTMISTRKESHNQLMPIYGFAHIAAMSGWEDIVHEQLHKLTVSGLLGKTTHLYVTIVGDAHIRLDGDQITTIYQSENYHDAEFPILRFMHEFARTRDGFLYYIHTKGVSRPSASVDDWRHLMEHFIIERHNDCISVLASHDLCGVNWLARPWPHFSGNFWWARADYVRRLPSIDEIPTSGFLDHTTRHKCERWIGSLPARVACLHDSHIDHYTTRYPAERYRDSSQPGILRLSVPREFVRRPVYGFIHVAAMRHWRRILDDQLLKIRACGLWERMEHLTVGILGEVDTELDINDDKVSVVRLGPDFDHGERPTLSLLRAHCLRSDCDVFYLHTKGVGRPSEGQEQWRRCMEHFIITKHETCLASLYDHDVCGINWADAGWCRFFGGNIWWAKSAYIRSLPDIATLPPIAGRDPSPRHVCERWIGENPAVNPRSLFQAGVDHYAGQVLPRSAYATYHDVIPDEAFGTSSWAGLENRFQDLLEPLGPARLIVDMGVDYGFSLFTFARAAPQALVVGIDPYLPPSGDGGGMVAVRSAAERWVRDHLPMFPNAVLLKTSEMDAARLVSGSIDVIHFGSPNGYRDIKALFEEWEPKLRRGGCALFHGTQCSSHDVGRLFQALPGTKAEIRCSDGLGAWYKI